MNDTARRFGIALAICSTTTFLACSGADPGPDTRTTGSALAGPNHDSPGKPECTLLCAQGSHCELVAYACIAGGPGLVGPCPPYVEECVADQDYPTCATTPIKCDRGEICVDVPQDCAPPTEGPAACVPSIPMCEPFPGGSGGG